MTDVAQSHDSFIEQGIRDYENTFQDFDLILMIDEIIKLWDLKARIEKLIISMKNNLLDSYIEKKVDK